MGTYCDNWNILEIAVSNLFDAVSKNTIAIDDSWRTMDEYNLWLELVSCILGSKVLYEQAKSAINHLDKSQLLNFSQWREDYIKAEENIYTELSRPIYEPISSNRVGSKYRYPAMRANHICRTAKNIYGGGTTIKSILETCKDGYNARQAIMSLAVGIGPKQASMFLRNIGYTKHLAILDRHVLDYMHLLGMIPEVMAITGMSAYLKIEKKLQHYANQLRVHLSQLDTAIWVVMRVYKREFV